MDKIQNALRQAAVKDQIKTQDALRVGAEADELLEESVELFRRLHNAVGMYLGGEIDLLVSKITKVKSRGQVYHLDREPEGQ